MALCFRESHKMVSCVPDKQKVEMFYLFALFASVICTLSEVPGKCI